MDTPNLQADRLIRPELVTPGWVAEKRAEWGEESPIYQVRVLGEFPDRSEDCLFPLSWIEAAAARWVEMEGLHHGGTEARRKAHGEEREENSLSPCSSPCLRASVVDLDLPAAPAEIGVDVARYGGCETVAVVRRGDVVTRLAAWQGQDLMVTAGRIAALVRAEGEVRAVKVDAIGLGAGVVDRLREQGYSQVIGVNVAEPAQHRDRYASRRDEIFFALRDRFRAGEIAARDEKLASQLSALRYSYTSRGQLKVESKEELRRRGVASPDRADALALAFAALPASRVPYVAAGAGRPGLPRLGD